MRDDDRLLDLPDPEFGSGVIGPCDICGVRQAVIVLSKERYRLCVIDFLNKAWVKSDKKASVPVPAYRSERVWFPSRTVPGGQAQGVVLTPTKLAKHPVVLITPDVFGLTTTLLDAAIRFAREGFEVLLPDLGKLDGVGPGHHLALRRGARLGRGVPVTSKRVTGLVALYREAFDALLAREMVDPARSAVFGVSYGASLALAFAAETTQLAAVALAYPMPVDPARVVDLVTAPVLSVYGARDRAARRATTALTARAGTVPAATLEVPDVGHGFLSRDLRGYDLAAAEVAWARILTFLKDQLMPPPPKPPAPKPAAPAAPVAPPPAPAARPVPAPAP